MSPAMVVEFLGLTFALPQAMVAAGLVLGVVQVQVADVQEGEVFSNPQGKKDLAAAV